MVHWYFAQLDNNGSHDINNKELKPFKRYLKKKAKPKKCARKFTDYCDLNKDRAISLQELKGCLGVSKEGKRRRQERFSIVSEARNPVIYSDETNLPKLDPAWFDGLVNT